MVEVQHPHPIWLLTTSIITTMEITMGTVVVQPRPMEAEVAMVRANLTRPPSTSPLHLPTLSKHHNNFSLVNNHSSSTSTNSFKMRAATVVHQSPVTHRQMQWELQLSQSQAAVAVVMPPCLNAMACSSKCTVHPSSREIHAEATNSNSSTNKYKLKLSHKSQYFLFFLFRSILI